MIESEKEIERSRIESQLALCRQYTSALDLLLGNGYQPHADLLIGPALHALANLLLALNNRPIVSSRSECAAALKEVKGIQSGCPSSTPLIALLENENIDCPSSPEAKIRAIRTLQEALTDGERFFRKLVAGPLRTASDRRRFFLKSLLGCTTAILILAAIPYGKHRGEMRRSAFLQTPSGAAVRDLIKIRDALNRYHADHNSYPSTQNRWDGLFSCFGESREDWIQGLSPSYIDKLPRDPRKNSECLQQYYYRSDGSDYKLISHSAIQVIEVSLYFPEMIDRERQTYAYGFWTPGWRQK
jgi:hypothetical protein